MNSNRARKVKTRARFLHPIKTNPPNRIKSRLPERGMLALSSALGVVLVLVLCGCAGYRLGPVNGVAARERSVQVNPFINETHEPHLTDATTQQLRKALQQDGT